MKDVIMYRSSKSVYFDLSAWQKKTKKMKEGQRKRPYCAKFGIRPDHARRRIEIKFCTG